MQNQIYDVVVMGGGASGMMAAGTAASLGKRVLIRNDGGWKSCRKWKESFTS